MRSALARRADWTLKLCWACKLPEWGMGDGGSRKGQENEKVEVIANFSFIVLVNSVSNRCCLYALIKYN